MHKFLPLLVVCLLFLLAAAGTHAQSPRMSINAYGHTAKIQNLLFTPDGSRIVTISEDKTVRFWNTGTGEMIAKLEGENGDGWEGMLYASAISPDGKLLAVAGYPVASQKLNYIVIIDLKTYKQVSAAVGHTDVINTVAFTSSGDGLLSGSNDGTIIHWPVSNEKTWSASATLRVGSPVTCFSLNSKTQDLAVVAGGKDIRLYSLRDLKANRVVAPRIWRRHQGELHKVAYSPDGVYLGSSSLKNDLIIWRTDGNVELMLDKLKSPINALAFSYDSKIVAALDFTGKGATWSVQSGHVFTEYQGHDNMAFSVAFLPGIQANYTVASAGSINNEIILWNAINGSTIRHIKGRGKAIRELAFGADLELFVAQDARENGSPLFATSFNFATMSRLSNPDGTKIRTSESSNVFQTGQNELTLPRGRTIVTNQDTDGRLLDYLELNDGSVIVASDFSLKMFDKHGFLLKDFIGHSGAVRALAVTADGRYLASGGEDQTIILWNLFESGSVATLQEVLPESRWQQIFSIPPVDSLSRIPLRSAWTDALTYMKTKGHKTLQREIEEAYSMLGENIIPFATLFMSLDSQWVCWNPKGYFHCSSSGSQYFGWHVNKGINELAEFYDADQYYEILLSPEEMTQSIVSGKRVEEIIREEGKRIFDFSKLHKPSAAFFRSEIQSESNVLTREHGKIFTKAETIPLTIDIYDGGGGVKELNVYRNDKLILIDKEIHTKAFREKVTKTYQLEMANDINEFKVKVINYQKIESKPDVFVVEYIGRAITTSTLHILSVGINKYQNEAYELNYAQPDAKAFAAKLIEKSAKIFKAINHVEIYDQEATKENIVRGFNSIIEKAKPEDMFLFYYAGHGILDEESAENEYYFVPSDVLKLYGDPGQLAKKALSASELKSYLVQVKSQKQLILMDACQSGGAMKWLRTRAAGMDEKAIKQLARASGVAIMASSGTKQLSTEFEALKHGVFTYALLEALDGKADNGDKQITIHELKSYMDDRVPELSKQYGGKAQSPTYHFDGDDFPISVCE